MNDTIKTMKDRRSVRSFTDKEISSSVIKDIFEAAKYYPSGMNFQPCEVVLVDDKQTLMAMQEQCTYGKFLTKAPLAAVIIAKKTNDFGLEIQDGSAFTQNIMLAAKSLDIGSCWIFGNGASYANDILKIIDAPESYMLISIIALGYYENEPQIPAKKEYDKIVHWNKF